MHTPVQSFLKIQWSRKNFLSTFILLCLSLFSLTLLQAAPAYRYSYEEDIREIRENLDTLKHEVSNHDTELLMFDERVNNQESTVSSLRQQLLDANQVNKDLVKFNSASMETKLATIETSNKSLISDIHVLKNHANESATALNHYKNKVEELEQQLGKLHQNIESLQAAMRSLTEALKEGTVSENERPISKFYRIKTGDSLEKIARAHGTTIKAIKELNNLVNDRIVVGQSIKLP